MKAKHKHIYKLFLVQTKCTPHRYTLMKKCTVCGKIKIPEFSMSLGTRQDGTYKWLTTLQDFTEVFGDLPILYNVEDIRYI